MSCTLLVVLLCCCGTAVRLLYRHLSAYSSTYTSCMLLYQLVQSTACIRNVLLVVLAFGASFRSGTLTLNIEHCCCICWMNDAWCSWCGRRWYTAAVEDPGLLPGGIIVLLYRNNIIAKLPNFRPRWCVISVHDKFRDHTSIDGTPEDIIAYHTRII